MVGCYGIRGMYIRRMDCSRRMGRNDKVGSRNYPLLADRFRVAVNHFSSSLLASLLCFIIAMASLYTYAEADAALSLRAADLEPIAEIVAKEIQAGRIPGAVVLIGHQGKVVYRRAFGYRALKPEKLLMTEDTIFDLASLTKVIGTTTAVMQLVENGKLSLEDPVATYWPEFKAY